MVKGSQAEGKRIKELNLPELCTVGLIVREGELIPAVGDTKLRENDRIVLVGRSKDVVSAIDLFRKS
ncbi:hypothetical protein AKJ45_00355 [candidate division MSBL1 archaeon SCGC-AAA261F19]|uniref:RCK C-terminal domain-containing protein n=2 Tax=candidate division MSBL1 TaxID=215777 RepID=A0A133VBI9_9EURY|nr:hypothetical protein AKJ43_00355 [candidate division MSBL1 archaeon SCGC-AAA261D19]KXB03777.1 hypothetical protein AKJ45_00355 [candidate division MSBL1 archaeon SCGC-AAA261F19]